MKTITVLLLAGQRPGTDPICSVYGTHYKSLAPVAGEPMILHPLRTLGECEYISEIIVLAQQPDRIREALNQFPLNSKVRFVRSSRHISTTVLDAWKSCNLSTPLLVTTADNCLLGKQHLENFLSQALQQPSDISMGFVSKDRVQASHPETGRTWISFNETELTGCNLFLFKSAQARHAIQFWKDFESRPKKILRMAWMLGPSFFWHYLTRNLSLAASFEKISVLAGATVSPVLLDQPDVAIDADKLSDIRQIESILGFQQTTAPVTMDKPVVIFDLDRTITDFGTYTPFLLYYALKTNPLKLLWLPIIIVLMIGYKLGILNRGQLKARMFALLAGHPEVSTLHRVCNAFVDRSFKRQVYRDALDTIRRWKDKQATLILATASYDWMANIFASHLGFDKVVATRSILQHGHVVPGTDGENCYGQEKCNRVNAALGQLQTLREQGQQVWFYTDDHSDISLLQQCSHPVAINPTRKLRRWADTTINARVIEWRHQPAANDQTGGIRPATVFSQSLAKVSAVFASLFLITTLSSSDMLWANDEIPLSSLPAEVIQSALSEFPELNLLRAEIDFENGMLYYELDVVINGENFELEILPDGTILALEAKYLFEQRIALNQLPSVVVQAAHAAVPGISLLAAEIEYSNDTHHYEIEGIADGMLYEIELATDGSVIAIERETSRNHRIREQMTVYYSSVYNRFL